MNKIKNIRIIALAIFMMIGSNAAYSQIIKGYVAGGTNLSQVDGDEDFGFNKFGLNVGLGVDVSFSRLFSGTIEANFNQKGAKKFVFNNDGYTLNANYAEVPIMFHVSDERIKFGIGFSYAALVGNVRENESRHNYETLCIYNKTDEIESYSDFSQRVGANNPEAYMTQVVDPWNEAHNKFARNNFNILVDLTFKIWKQIKGNIRYSYSINSFRNVDYCFYQGVPASYSKMNHDVYTDGDFVNSDYYGGFQRQERHNCLSFRLLFYFNEKQVKENKAKEEEAKRDLRLQ